MKKVCIGLGILAAVLLLAIAFLLGRQFAGGKNSGAGRNTSDVADATGGFAALPDGALNSEGGSDASAPAATAPGGETAQTAVPAQPATTQPPASVPTDIPRSLSVDMSNGSLTFETGSAFAVKCDTSVTRVENTDGVLSIRNAKEDPDAGERRRMDVTVVVPEGFSFEEVDVELSAGKLITKTLRTEELELELGAGSASLDGLYVTGSAEIKTGAGAFAVKGGAINDLTMQCGAGAAQVKAALTGSSRIVVAFGALDLDVDGKESDYTVSFQVSLGTCTYNDRKIARSGSYGSGPNRVDITGGLGVIRVNVG